MLLWEGNLNLSHCYQFGAGPSSTCPEPGGGLQVSKRAPERQEKGIRASKSALLGAQLKCLYGNTCSMRNKQEELKKRICLQGYDLTDITEMWWDGSCGWSVGMEGYRLFGKDGQGRRGVGVVLCL